MKRIFCIFLALITALTISSCASLSPVSADEENAKLIVHFIDVGQGDCTLLESDGEFVLIDAGERDYGEKVLQYIDNRGADELKYVIATHPHTDHFGGLRTIINNMTVENFITCGAECDTYSWTKLLKAVEKHNVNTISAKPGSTYSFGHADFTVLAPLSSGYEGYNNTSVVTRAECGSVSFLLTGDAGTISEKEMLEADETLSADVLKCGHHGSSSSTSAGFLKAVNPSCAVISCGESNDYGHPHRETLYKLNALGCDVFRTDTMGTIVAYTDGKSLNFSAGKSDLSSFTYTGGKRKTTPEALNYIGNKKSRYFHNPDCEGVEKMNSKNKIEFATREEAVAAGYNPCPSCQP